MPRYLTFFSILKPDHSSSLLTSSFHIFFVNIFVLSRLTLRPATSPYSVNFSSSALIEGSDSSIMNARSSTYAQSLYSSFLILSPLILVSSRTDLHRILRDRIKSRGDNGQPWRVPFPITISSVKLNFSLLSRINSLYQVDK